MPAAALSLQAAYIEEIVNRGILLRIVEESLGTWLALLISALLFGLGHLGSPNATVSNAIARPSSLAG